jgi:hypothetical protein
LSLLQEVETVVQRHNDLWKSRKADVVRYERAYRAEMFEQVEDTTVETPDGHSLVEGYIASLFPKAPAVEVGEDPADRGDSELVRFITNQFMAPLARVMKRAMRYSFAFQFGALKVGYDDRPDDMSQRAEVRAVHPWNVILDVDADEWDTQRFVGHRYYLTVADVKKRFPGRKWSPVFREDFLRESRARDPKPIGSDMLDEVLVYEIYFPYLDELVFYSPHVDKKEQIIKSGPIPYRNFNGTPKVPLVMAMFKEDLKKPLLGMSTVGLMYDQLWEKNNVRTERAKDVRRNARQAATRKGALDSEAKARYADNVDGALLELDIPPDMPVDQAIRPIQQMPVSRDYDLYEARIDADLSTGDIRSPITRGQSTGASATEIAALTQYLATEVGQMAVTRDRMFTDVAEIYVAMLRWQFETAKHPEELARVYYLNGTPHTLALPALEGQFTFAAVDQGATPVGKAVERNALERLVPMLVQLGADPHALLRHLVQSFDLPPELVPAKPEGDEPVQPLSTASQPEQRTTVPNPTEGAGAVPVTGGSAAAQLRQDVLDAGA